MTISFSSFALFSPPLECQQWLLHRSSVGLGPRFVELDISLPFSIFPDFLFLFCIFFFVLNMMPIQGISYFIVNDALWIWSDRSDGFDRFILWQQPWQSLSESAECNWFAILAATLKSGLFFSLPSQISIYVHLSYEHEQIANHLWVFFICRLRVFRWCLICLLVFA